MIAHEPCASRGDCYHVRGGRNGTREAKARAGRIGGLIGGRISGRKNVESGRLAEARKKSRAVFDANPEILRNAGRAGSRENKSRAGHIAGRIAVESGQFARMLALPQTKTARQMTGRKNVESGHLERARMVKTSPSKEEIQRLHIPLAPLGFEFNQYLKVDSGASIEVDAVKGKTVVFYDGTYWHSRPEVVRRDQRDTARLRAAGYTVFRFFGRAPTEAEMRSVLD